MAYLKQMQPPNRKLCINMIWLTLIVVLAALTYKATLVWMYDRYMGADSYYSHGFLVPFVTLFFVYQLRGRIASAHQKSSPMGLAIVICALLLHVLGTILYVFSISGFSLLLLVIGLTLFWAGKEITKIIWFPLVFLVFMFPLPMAVIELFSFPLKIFAAYAGVWIVRILGVPVYAEGFNIFIPAGHLVVGNPCSGLRSLIVFLAMGSMLAYITPVSNVKKCLLFSLAIPIALISNIIRVPILILVSNYWGLEAAAPDTVVHTGSGILVFVLGLLLFFYAAKVLK